MGNSDSLYELSVELFEFAATAFVIENFPGGTERIQKNQRRADLRDYES
jgi:hypothetical protein